jgi:hypothetical protein
MTGICRFAWTPSAKLVSALQHVVDYVALFTGFFVAIIGFNVLTYYLPEQCEEDDDRVGQDSLATVCSEDANGKYGGPGCKKN